MDDQNPFEEEKTPPATVQEKFTLDLYDNFVGHLDAGDKEAIAIYESMLKFIDKKRDEFLAVKHDMPEDISPADLAKMHQDSIVDTTQSHQGVK